MKRSLILSFFLVCVLVTSAFAAGTVSVTTGLSKDPAAENQVRWVRWAWESTDGTATASGGSTSTLDELRNNNGAVTGFLVGIKAEPHATNQPDNLYDIDVKIKNRDGTGNNHDVTNGAGDNLLQAVASDGNIRSTGDSTGDRTIFIDGVLSFSGTNLNAAGTASGTYTIYVLLP